MDNNFIIYNTPDEYFTIKTVEYSIKNILQNKNFNLMVSCSKKRETFKSLVAEKYKRRVLKRRNYTNRSQLKGVVHITSWP